MPVAETSLQAFKTLKDLSQKQEQVFEAAKELGRASNEQLADYLGWTINKITPRTNELAKFGFLAVDGVTRTKAGKSAKVFVTANPNDNRVIEQLVGKQPGKAVSWLNDEDRSY